MLSENTRVIIFDFDETIATLDADWVSCRKQVQEVLVASYPDAASWFSKALSQSNMSHLSVEAMGSIVYNHIGSDVYGIYEDIQEQCELAAPLKDVDRAIVKFIQSNELYQLAICTNNSEAGLRKGLRELGIENLFQVLSFRRVGRPPKPHIDPMQYILDTLDVSVTECVYVGNNPKTDEAMADAMGMQYFDHEEFSSIIV